MLHFARYLVRVILVRVLRLVDAVRGADLANPLTTSDRDWPPRHPG